MYERYCELRDKKGYKDADISKNTGITKSTFTDWKNGKSKPNAEKLILISKALDTTVEYLMTGEDVSNREKAKIDVQISRHPHHIKEYMLKFANLPDEKRQQIMTLIDMLAE